jgi:hypothetical protein
VQYKTSCIVAHLRQTCRPCGIWFADNDFEKELKRLFRRKTDLVLNRYVQNPFFRKKIDETKQLV